MGKAKMNWTESELSEIYTSGTATNIETHLALEDLMNQRDALRIQIGGLQAECYRASREIAALKIEVLINR